MGFVLNQWVDRHGSVTNVVKTAGNVVKTVVKTAPAGGCAARGAAVGGRAGADRGDVSGDGEKPDGAGGDSAGLGSYL